MKTLLVSIVLLSVSLTQAMEIKVGSYNKAKYVKISPSFNFNSELGRAWVEVDATVASSDPESLPEVDTYKHKIPGLRFDSKSLSVVYKSAEQSQVTCSTAKKAKQSSLKMTSSCKFVLKDETVLVDDGYYLQKVDYHTVYLQVAEE